MNIRHLLALSMVMATGLELRGQTPEKVLVVIGAHSDDLVSIAGGTFAKYIAQGYRGVSAVLTTHKPGAKVHPGTIEPETLEAIQLQTEHALEAARHHGATPVFFNLHPTRIRHGRALAFTGSSLWSRTPVRGFHGCFTGAKTDGNAKKQP